MVGWSDQFIEGDSRTTIRGHPQKSNPPESDFWPVCTDISISESQAPPLLSIQNELLYDVLSMQTNHRRFSCNNKKEEAIWVDNDFEPHETFVGMYHIDNIKHARI